MAAGQEDPDTPPPSTALERLSIIRRELALLTQELSDGLPVKDQDDIALEDVARGLLWQRAIMAEHLDPEFIDPASNILLFVYAAGRDTVCTTGACCDAARVPRTTALRFITILESRGLVTSFTDPTDRRRTSISLSGRGRTAMRNCLKAIADSSATGLVRL